MGVGNVKDILKELLSGEQLCNCYCSPGDGQEAIGSLLLVFLSKEACRSNRQHHEG